MDYRPLGHSGLKVSPICLGTMMFGDQADSKTAASIIGIARDSGINYIDTADVYNRGRSERIVGKNIAADRDRWVLATKAGNAVGSGPNERGLGRKWLLQAIDGSLERLDTDYVDIWYLHRPDADTPLEETVGAMADVLATGKARYWGISNFHGWAIAEAVRVADSLGVARPVVCQPQYNALNRLAEVDVLPACEHYGIGVTPHSVLARGVLTGKYKPDGEPPADSRGGRADKRFLELYYHRECMEAAEAIAGHARGRGMSPGDFAYLWMLNNRIVTSVLAGPRTVEQWEAALGALRHEFTPEDEAFVDSLVTPGHPALPGFADPRFPVSGRRPHSG